MQYPNASEFFRRSEEESFFVYLTTVRCTLTTPARFCDGCPDGCSASISMFAFFGWLFFLFGCPSICNVTGSVQYCTCSNHFLVRAVRSSVSVSFLFLFAFLFISGVTGSVRYCTLDCTCSNHFLFEPSVLWFLFPFFFFEPSVVVPKLENSQ